MENPGGKYINADNGRTQDVAVLSLDKTTPNEKLHNNRKQSQIYANCDATVIEPNHPAINCTKQSSDILLFCVPKTVQRFTFYICLFQPCTDVFWVPLFSETFATHLWQVMDK